MYSIREKKGRAACPSLDFSHLNEAPALTLPLSLNPPRPASPASTSAERLLQAPAHLC